MEPGEYDRIAQLEERHWWYLGMRAIARNWLEQLAGQALSAAAPLPWRILDAGCGAGGGLHWLKSFGIATGIDLHASAIAYARQASSSVARASVQALPFPTNHFDLVTSFEVLYHLAVTDDAGAIEEVARVLRPGGAFLVRVPAHDWLRGAHDRQVHTRHRYGRAELRQKLAGAGLQVSRLSAVGLTILPPALLVRALQGHTSASSDVTLPSPLANRLLLGFLQSESLWLRRWSLPAGLSLLALARKPEQKSAPSPQSHPFPRGEGAGG